MANWLCLKLFPRKLVIIWVACYRLFQIHVLRKVYVVLSFEINLRVAWDRRRQVDFEIFRVRIHCDLKLKADLGGGAGLLSRKWPRLQQHASKNPCFNILGPNPRFSKDVSHLEWHLFCYLGSSQPTNYYLHWSVHVGRHTHKCRMCIEKYVRTCMHQFWCSTMCWMFPINCTSSPAAFAQVKSDLLFVMPSSNHQLCIPFH